MTFIFVQVGWIFSLCLHEFAHAAVAFLGGDTSVREKGYLTFNPLRYVDPIASLFVAALMLRAARSLLRASGRVFLEAAPEGVDPDTIGRALASQPGVVEVHDLHATMLHLLGIDHKRLTFRFGGRDMRLTDVHGEVIRAILA